MISHNNLSNYRRVTELATSNEDPTRMMDTSNISPDVTVVGASLINSIASRPMLLHELQNSPD